MTAAFGSEKAQAWYIRREASTKVASSCSGGVEAASLRKACSGSRYLRGKAKQGGFIWKGKAVLFGKGKRAGVGGFEGQGWSLLRCGTYAFSREDMRLLDAAQAAARAASLDAAANVELSG